MELLPLLCLCVLTRSGTTSADQHGPETITVTEGSDVTLPCSTSEDLGLRRFEWKKDDQKEVFVYDGSVLSGQHEQFKGRVSYFPGELRNGKASITIRDMKLTDSGDYTCEIQLKNLPNQKFLIKLLVGAAPEPSITILDQTQDGALLQCVVPGAFPKPKVQWQDSDGNILPAKEPLVFDGGGRFVIILQTTVTKTDHYRCVSTQEKILHELYAEIYVPLHEYPTGHVVGAVVASVLGTLLLVGVLAVLRAKGYIKCGKGAAPEPSITTLDQTQDRALLQCVVRGASPKSTVQWQDSDGNILPAKEPLVFERGGRYVIILQTTVTKTDLYRCVATQEEFNHQIHAEIYVHINDRGNQ